MICNKIFMISSLTAQFEEKIWRNLDPLSLNIFFRLRKSLNHIFLLVDDATTIYQFYLQAMANSTARTKFIIHPQPQQKAPRPTNIFLNHHSNSSALQNFTMYSIVGDPAFKHRFYQQRSPPSSLDNKLTSKTLDDTLNETFCHYTRSLQNKTLTDKLSLSKQLEVTHDERTLTQMKNFRERDRKIEKYIKYRTNKPKLSETITFGSVQQIYVHPNPEKAELINDNIPEYWKNSLRDNEKRLKRHVKGNSFKREVADEMLQTLRGRRKLEHSIPKLKEQFRSIPCSRDVCKELRNRRRKGFSLLGRKVTVDYQKIEDTPLSRLQPSSFDEVHKLQYDAGRRWKANQL